MKHLSPSELKISPDIFLLDVRQPEEHQIAKIAGSTLIPMMEIPNRIDEIALLTEGKKMVVYCHHGGRSERVVQYLESVLGGEFFNLEGGIDRYSIEVDKNIKRY